MLIKPLGLLRAEVAAAASVEAATFDNTTWVDMSADLPATASEFVIAFRSYNRSTNLTGNRPIILGSDTNALADTYIIFDGSQSGRFVARFETNTGAGSFFHSTVPLSIGTGVSVMLRMKSGDMSLWVDGVEVDTETGTWASLKMVQFVNTDNGAGGGAFNVEIEGVAIFTSAGCADATTGLAYADFFDGSNVPLPAAFGGSAVSGFTPAITFASVADWNNYAGTTGTVT